MSQILLAFCLQKKLKVFGECLITEKKRSGFEVFKHGEAKCITKYKMKKQSRFEGVTHGKAMCVIRKRTEIKQRRSYMLDGFTDF